jgi:hypothetical protein
LPAHPDSILSGIAASEVPATLRGLKWVQLEPYEQGLRQLVEVCYDVSIKPPLGDPPPWAIERPLESLGLSANAQRLAAWINAHSTDGTAYEIFERDALIRELELTAQEIGMAASELSDAAASSCSEIAVVAPRASPIFCRRRSSFSVPIRICGGGIRRGMPSSSRRPWST